MTQPIVAVATDVRQFENYTWHAAPRQYLDAAISVAGVLPVLVPSFGERLDLEGLIGRVDGLILTGSKSNVDPALYGAEATEENGPYDRERDATTIPLIRLAIEHGVPLLAICRGVQELNVALGGTLDSEIHEMEGRIDHRAPASEDPDERFSIRQKIEITQGSCLSQVLGIDSAMVNSVHRQAIGQLGSRLQVEAVAEDGTIEAVSVIGSKTFAVGVQWHPEYWAKSDDVSARILRSFGEAARAHASSRHGNFPQPARQSNPEPATS